MGGRSHEGFGVVGNSLAYSDNSAVLLFAVLAAGWRIRILTTPTCITHRSACQVIVLSAFRVVDLMGGDSWGHSRLAIDEVEVGIAVDLELAVSDDVSDLLLMFNVLQHCALLTRFVVGVQDVVAVARGTLAPD